MLFIRFLSSFVDILGSLREHIAVYPKVFNALFLVRQEGPVIMLLATLL